MAEDQELHADMFKRMAELWIELIGVVKAATGRGRRTQGMGFAAAQKASRSAAEVSSSHAPIAARRITPSQNPQVICVQHTRTPCISIEAIAKLLTGWLWKHFLDVVAIGER